MRYGCCGAEWGGPHDVRCEEDYLALLAEDDEHEAEREWREDWEAAQ